MLCVFWWTSTHMESLPKMLYVRWAWAFQEPCRIVVRTTSHWQTCNDVWCNVFRVTVFLLSLRLETPMLPCLCCEPCAKLIPSGCSTPMYAPAILCMPACCCPVTRCLGCLGVVFCVLSTTRAQTADACAARILVDTGKEDFIAFVMEQQVCSFPTSAPFNGCLPVHSPICPVV